MIVRPETMSVLDDRFTAMLGEVPQNRMDRFSRALDRTETQSNLEFDGEAGEYRRATVCNGDVDSHACTRFQWNGCQIM